MQLSSSLLAALAVCTSLVSAQDSGTVPIAAGGPQWDLYIRALTAMYRASATDPLSYFQVAGIHGRPYIEWNGAGARNNQGWGGYCPHGERIFLTWHRPYVALFEQILVEHATRIAEEYPGEEYQEAARNLRSPFWDWGLGEGVPAVTAEARVIINVPRTGSNETQRVRVDNPLYTYRFPRAALNGTFGTFPTSERMVRCPAPNSYPDSANSLLSARPYKAWVYDALTRSRTFDEFASTGSRGTSLEMIHNGIHWDGGCGGQFLAAETSAFDPLFWMHHTNVDRNWAYYQAIRPNNGKFTGSYRGQARFNSPSGTTIRPSSPLQPFFDSDGEFLTSESVSNIYDFGYTYEGLEQSKSTTQKTRDALRLVNRLYGNGNGQRRRDNVVGSPNGKKTRHFAGIEVNVEELDRPCVINVYVKGRHAGGVVVMMQPEKGTFNGEFTIDEAVHGGYKSNSTLGSVKDGVEIEIVKFDGTKIPVENVPSLNVDVENCDYTPPKAEDELPTYGTPSRLPVPPVEYTNTPPENYPGGSPGTNPEPNPNPETNPAPSNDGGNYPSSTYPTASAPTLSLPTGDASTKPGDAVSTRTSVVYAPPSGVTTPSASATETDVPGAANRLGPWGALAAVAFAFLAL